MPSYTLNELIEAMEPQSRRDKALMGRCVEGLGLYAAQLAEDDRFSSKIDEIRKLADNLVGYWGLGFEDGSKSAKEFMQAFDDRVDEARTGGAVGGDVYQTAPNVIYGLHRYGQDMVASAGQEAMNDILKVNQLMKEIAKHWDFEPAVVDDLTAHLEAEVRGLLESTPMPGQTLTDVRNSDYVVTQAVLFNNDRGFALAHSPTAPDSFVTWQITHDKDDGTIDFYWGHYLDSEEAAKVDYVVRATEYQGQYGLKEQPLPLDAFEKAPAQTVEAAPVASHIPVEVTTATQPLVTVTFSECKHLRGIENMPLYMANDLFGKVDAMPSHERSADGAPYDKTDFRIDFIKNGKPEVYTGRYDVGDGDGTLIEHIRGIAEYQRLNDGHQHYLAGKGDGFQAVENARLDFIAGVLVPIFEKHCEISQLEASAMSELMSIYEGADGKPPETDSLRIAYLESVVDYTGHCREALNTKGLYNLPEAPVAFHASNPEMNESEVNFVGWLAVTESSRYRWVEDDIYRLNGRGAMYYTGGEDGVYMRIQQDGKLEAGNYEGAFPHIGEAMFKPVVTKQFDSFSEAYKSAMEAGGKQFMVDMFSNLEPQPITKTTERDSMGGKPSVLDEIRESRSAPNHRRSPSRSGKKPRKIISRNTKFGEGYVYA